MSPPRRTSRRRDLAPSLESLESRRLLSSGATSSTQAPADFLAQLPATADQSISTVPANGDVNPYGVAIVPRGYLVTNFNDSNNDQGTGTTIEKVWRDGHTSTFFQGGPGLGLTDAIGVLRKGFVFVGSVPTTDGTSATVQQGSLLILDRNGRQVAELKNSKLLDGPWGMAVNDQGSHAQVFVSNVLNGTVTRLDVSISHGKPKITSAVQIATGYTTQTDPNALVLGPTGLAYDAQTDTLYVASTADNAIYAIADAGHRDRPVDKGQAVVQDDSHLHGPIGLTFAPNGHLLVTNGDAVNPDPNAPSTVVEYTRQGQFVDQLSIDSNPGAAFGLVVRPSAQGEVLATVNDATNTLDLRTLATKKK